MTRYHFSTLLFILAAVIAWPFFGNSARWWVTGAIFLADVILVVCGIAFIWLQFFGPAFCHGDRSGKTIALTFDDGPDPEATPALLKLLKEQNVRATFFMIGRRVVANPHFAAEVSAAGHAIGNHTYRHHWTTNLMLPWVLEEEITRTQEAIQEATGQTPLLMRPPMGLTNPLYRRILRKHGLTLVGWDIRSFDGYRKIGSILSRVRRLARGGSVVVLHDGPQTSGETPEITRALIEDLRSRGFEFVGVDEMLETPHKKSKIRVR